MPPSGISPSRSPGLHRVGNDRGISAGPRRRRDRRRHPARPGRQPPTKSPRRSAGSAIDAPASRRPARSSTSTEQAMFAKLRGAHRAWRRAQIFDPARQANARSSGIVAPIETAGPAFDATCNDNDEWDKPAPPVRIHGNTYLVGTCGISAILITGSDGDIVIDSGTEAGADLVAANIRRPRLQADGRQISAPQPRAYRSCRRHGAAAAADRRAAYRLSPRPPRCSRPARRALPIRRSGCTRPSPLLGSTASIEDGGTVRLGDLMLTAIATPGHTPGALSWHWVSCDGGVCRTHRLCRQPVADQPR